MGAPLIENGDALVEMRHGVVVTFDAGLLVCEASLHDIAGKAIAASDHLATPIAQATTEAANGAPRVAHIILQQLAERAALDVRAALAWEQIAGAVLDPVENAQHGVADWHDVLAALLHA